MLSPEIKYLRIEYSQLLSLWHKAVFGGPGQSMMQSEAWEQFDVLQFCKFTKTKQMKTHLIFLLRKRAMYHNPIYPLQKKRLKS